MNETIFQLQTRRWALIREKNTNYDGARGAALPPTSGKPFYAVYAPSIVAPVSPAYPVYAIHTIPLTNNAMVNQAEDPCAERDINWDDTEGGAGDGSGGPVVVRTTRNPR